MSGGWEIRRDELTARQFMDMRSRCGLAELEFVRVEAALAGGIFTLSAYENGALAGMLRVIGDGSFVYLIYDVMVDPAFRRRGLGSRLVLRALTEIEEMSPPGQWVSINLFSAPGKEHFYERLGFVKLPREKLGPGMQLFLQGRK